MKSGPFPRQRQSGLVFLCLLLLVPALASATETRVTVRVLAKDAKFVGSSMGGVRVTIKDAQSGELLADGLTRGSTGDTERIMKQDWKRGQALSTEGAAAFAASLDLDRPRLLEFTAFGPGAQLQGANRVTATQWIIPGKHIDRGDAMLLIMPGMLVDVLSPRAHIQMKGAPQTIEISANVIMMCGCPIEPGGLWDANKFEVVATVKHNGKPVKELQLKFAGETSRFASTYEATELGAYEVTVYAYDPSNGNTGLDNSSFVLKPKE